MPSVEARVRRQQLGDKESILVSCAVTSPQAVLVEGLPRQQTFNKH